MGLEPTTCTLQVRRATHCAMPIMEVNHSKFEIFLKNAVEKDKFKSPTKNSNSFTYL